MIYQKAPRKSMSCCEIPKEKGFYLEGDDYKDCIRQLKEWGAAHPEKWIYFYDCGLGPSKPVPVSKHLLEVAIYDYEPACFMMFWHLLQEGCEQKKEIDMMTDDEKSELYRKKLNTLSILGQLFRKGC
jgi:hypothetical protein